MENAKISIIVPAYNVASYLPMCLESLLAQTHTDIEILVVNDGSTDDTATVLDAYAAKDARIKPIHKENGGVTNARFCGIEHATGEWIGFVDGDDAIDTDMYERLLANAVKHDAQISHCGYRLVFENRKARYFYNTGRVVEQDTLTGLSDLLDGSFVEPGLCNKLFHKSLFWTLLHGDEMDRTIRITEDLLMNIILFKQAQKAIYEDFCPYQYYTRKGSATRSLLEEYKVFDPIRVKERLFSILPVEIKTDAQKAYAVTCVNIYTDLLSSHQHNAKAMRGKVREKLLEHYDWTIYASKKYRLMAGLIRYAPWLYRGVYAVYASTVRQKKYE